MVYTPAVCNANPYYYTFSGFVNLIWDDARCVLECNGITYETQVEYRFLVDCGEGTQRQILKASAGFKRLNRILIHPV